MQIFKLIRFSAFVAVFLLTTHVAIAQVNLYVSVRGNDKNSGTLSSPFRSVNYAIKNALRLTGKDVIIILRAGTYYIDSTVQINISNYRIHSLTIQPYRDEPVIFSGAMAVHPEWKFYKNGIFSSYLNLSNSPDRLFFNGKSLPMARYPNFDSTARVFNGTSADALNKMRVQGWKNPAGAYIHALHQGEWGGFHYRVTGKNENGELTMEGGWQNNRPAPMHQRYLFVENVFEELNAPGEWYFDGVNKILYLYPPAGANFHNAVIAVSRLNELIVIKGDLNHPVKNISIRNIGFTQTNRSFMLTKEPLLRSDWTIYRGGAILLDGTEKINISHCVFNELGGNAVFVSNYNKYCLIQDNHFYNIGASAIAFVGNPDAVRSPSFRYEQFIPWAEMDYTPGPRSNDYPQQCTVAGNLIHNIGLIEKQVAGVQISMASQITVNHNTIYKVPRAGINIGDGCWGGHILEFNDVFYTVLETGDHGAFNSWGRDRYWRPEREIADSIVTARPGIELLDVISPVIIRNNRFHCDHGWDIDLDDGSTNYIIYNNVCLNGGLKLREGYHRIVRNNVIINNTFHPHVWFSKSEDVFEHNIVSISYAPILIENWGKIVDSNFFLSQKALDAARVYKIDMHSMAGDPMFVDPIQGNYQVKPGSPALKEGFLNFPMSFGVTLPLLKKLAEKPPMPQLMIENKSILSRPVEWFGARLENIETIGERSAAGLHDNKGVLLLDVQPGTLSFKSGLQRGDVVVKMGEELIDSVDDFLQTIQKIKWMGSIECTIIRNQAKLKIVLKLKD